MFEVTQPGPDVWSPATSPPHLAMGMAAPLAAAETDSPNNGQVESYGKPIALGEIDIPALSQEILALLANPPEELKVGSPETAPFLSVHLGPFSVAEITIVPGATVSQRRLVVRINSPIVFDDTQSQQFVSSLIDRAIYELSFNPSNKVPECLPKTFGYKESISRSSELIKKLEEYFFDNKEQWLNKFRNNQMTENDLLHITSELWEFLTSFRDEQHQTPIGTKTYITLTGLVDTIMTGELKQAKTKLKGLWRQWILNDRDIGGVSSFVDTIFPESAFEPNRSRVLFPDSIELQLELTEDGMNEKTVQYGLALLKSASGIWKTQMSDRELILSAGGSLISPDEDSAVTDASRADQRLPTSLVEPSAPRRPLGFPGVTLAFTGLKQTNALTAQQTQRPMGFR